MIEFIDTTLVEAHQSGKTILQFIPTNGDWLGRITNKFPQVHRDIHLAWKEDNNLMGKIIKTRTKYGTIISAYAQKERVDYTDIDAMKEILAQLEPIYTEIYVRGLKIPSTKNRMLRDSAIKFKVVPAWYRL